MAADALRGFPKTIQTALREGKWDYATRLFQDEKYADDVRNSSWDLIPVISEHLTEENRCENNELFKCCVNLLNIISESSNSEEALLQFISEIEEATDEDPKFVTLLGFLHKVIARIPTKKVNSLAWSFNSIQTYLSHLEVPNYESLEGKERLLNDNSEEVRRIIRLYTEVIVFYGEYFKTVNNDTDQEIKNVLCKFLVQLLGTPLCYLSMEVFDKIKTDGRSIAENIVKMVFKTTSDPFKLTEMYNEKHNDELIKPDPLSIANLFYLVYYEGVCFELIPKVYSSRYIFESTLPLICVLLNLNDEILTEKALKLAQSIFTSIQGHSLSYLLLDCGDHSKFCKTLTKVIVHGNSEDVRKTALAVFTRYLKCFEIRGVYLIISNLMGIVAHTGLLGYLVTFYKDLLNQEFKENEEYISEYFRGPKLFAILRKFCCLNEKEETNIRENSDQILSTLNLLRYMALRDTNNVTKFWDFAPTLKDIYFDPLRRGLEMSKAHFELEIKNSKQGDISVPNMEADSSVTVNGIGLPNMNIEEKVQVLSGALTVFDVISSLLTRVTELIENTCKIWITCRKNYSQTTSDPPCEKYEEDIRNKILAASLPYVLELGWTKECLSRGAENAGYPGIAHGMFTRGAGDLVHYFNTSSNLKLVDILKQRQKEFEHQHVSPGEFVELAIQERLQMLVPYVNRWPQAIAIMSLPPNVPNALAALLAMVDDICYFAGDRSVDFNWYIRRLGVAGVYKATELYLIQDKSPEQKDTWEFLKRRMVDAVQLHSIISKSDIASQGAKDVAKSTFVTARNILGVNWNK